ncbi:MAG: hypothetical protein NTW96_09295, partial [Planctomycetia bacterium]|nr:hypothetical protein [Planctomycetia bacterium]
MRDWLSGRESNRGVSERCYRRLLVDPLEQRQLLSVTPASVKDILVNELYAVDQSTIAGQSLAADNDGDFVVTWTRYDDVLDALGNPVIDNETGLQMTDANIYARYFTDEVQRITLPDGVLTDNLLGSYATMTLDYNGNEVQKLSVTATYEPFVYSQSPIVGEFRLGFDVNGNSIIDAGESFMVLFDEADMEGNREAIEDGLQALGGALSDASVRIISPQEYEIAFGDASFGNDQPDIVVQSPNFTSGFFPVATITTERNPGEIVNIPISPDDPWLTAYAIEQYFKQTRTTIEIGPTGNQSFSANDEFFSLLPVYEPDTLRVGMPDVSVMPVSTPDDPLGLRTFDITFVGDSGKINQPELVVSAVKDELGNSLLASSQLDVRTIKETSPEFRVNADEPDNPFTPTVDKFDQTSPAVAMDADGDFIITWQSVVPSTPNSPASKVDIFARRFSPVGWQDPADVDFVQGVDALGGQFQVNTFTTGIQEDPSVGIDAAGNFTISWDTVGQDVSFFNGVFAQRFSR